MLKNLVLAALLFPLAPVPQKPKSPAAADHQTILEVTLDEEATQLMRWKTGWHDKDHNLLSKAPVFYTLDFALETLTVHDGQTIKLDGMSQLLKAADYQIWTTAMTLYARGGLACEGLPVSAESRIFTWDATTATYRVQAAGKTILAMTADKGISCGPDRLVPFPGNLEAAFNRSAISLLNTVIQLTEIAEQVTSAPPAKVRNHWQNRKVIQVGRVLQASVLRRQTDALLAGRY